MLAQLVSLFICTWILMYVLFYYYIMMPPQQPSNSLSAVENLNTLIEYPAAATDGEELDLRQQDILRDLNSDSNLLPMLNPFPLNPDQCASAYTPTTAAATHSVVIIIACHNPVTSLLLNTLSSIAEAGGSRIGDGGGGGNTNSQSHSPSPAVYILDDHSQPAINADLLRREVPLMKLKVVRTEKRIGDE